MTHVPSFTSLLLTGVAPNVKTYTTLMSACTRHGQWQRALEAFRRMEAAGLQPDVLAYNSAISAYAAAGLWEKAWALFGSESPTACVHALQLRMRSPPAVRRPSVEVMRVASCCCKTTRQAACVHMPMLPSAICQIKLSTL